MAEHAFAFLGIELIEFAGQNELEDGVSEKLESLIGLSDVLVLVGERGMGDGKFEEIGRLKGMPDILLKSLQCSVHELALE